MDVRSTVFVHMSARNLSLSNDSREPGKRLSAKRPFRCKIKWCFSASLIHSFKNNSNFAFADRFANHACWVRFAEPSPVWGCAERGVVEIHKKAFIRADS